MEFSSLSRWTNSILELIKTGSRSQLGQMSNSFSLIASFIFKVYFKGIGSIQISNKVDYIWWQRHPHQPIGVEFYLMYCVYIITHFYTRLIQKKKIACFLYFGSLNTIHSSKTLDKSNYIDIAVWLTWIYQHNKSLVFFSCLYHYR